MLSNCLPLLDWSQNHKHVAQVILLRLLVTVTRHASWPTILLSQGSSLQLQEPIRITPTRILTHRQLARIPIRRVHTQEPLLRDTVLHGLILIVITNISLLVHYPGLSLPRQLPLLRRRRYLRVLSGLPLLLITLYTPAKLPELLRQVAPRLADTKSSPTSKDCSPKSVRSVSLRGCRLFLRSGSFQFAT